MKVIETSNKVFKPVSLVMENMTELRMVRDCLRVFFKNFKVDDVLHAVSRELDKIIDEYKE